MIQNDFHCIANRKQYAVFALDEFEKLSPHFFMTDDCKLTHSIVRLQQRNVCVAFLTYPDDQN